jgi:hypothetical protein
MGLRPELAQNEIAAAGNLIQSQTSRVQGRSVVGLVQVSHVAPRSMPCSLTAQGEPLLASQSTASGVSGEQ